MFCPLTQCLQRPNLQLCPAAQAALKTHKVRNCIDCISSTPSPINPFMLWAELAPASTAGPLKRIFMKEADASNFFRRRSRRGVKSQDEINGEFTPALFEFGLRSGQPRWGLFVVIVGICFLLYKTFWQQNYSLTNFFTVVSWWKLLLCTLSITSSHFIINDLLLFKKAECGVLTVKRFWSNTPVFKTLWFAKTCYAIKTKSKSAKDLR